MKVEESLQVSNWKASDNLKAAKALISNPENWIKRYYEQDENGKVDPYNTLPACKFYTIGANQRASLSHFGSRLNDYSWLVKSEHRSDHETVLALTSRHLRQALNELFNSTRYSGVASYNDDPATTHEDILKLYDNAIAIAEKAESNA